MTNPFEDRTGGPMTGVLPVMHTGEGKENRRRVTRWWHNATLVSGLVLFALIVLAVVCAPLLTPYDPLQQDLANVLQPPSGAHPLGTDTLGRDLFARLLYGGRIDLRIALVAVILPFLIGSLLGLVAGYFGGVVDHIIMRVVDVFFALPFYVIVIALVFVLGGGEHSIYLAIAISSWVAYTKIVRGEVMSVRSTPYIAAAKLGGLSDGRIISRHLLRNVMAQAIAYAMSDIVLTILAIVTLGYLGLGISPPTPDWGGMISEGQSYITTHWWMSTVPGLAVVITGISLSLIGDGINEVTSKERRG